ncbi:hypothetical protein V7O66_02820 [Methanolobus sp. ZRKC3]|uniref:hypothetical protein n=1 Tax=Methanolobus sp. ZRKC3 TaxID=3125786 RepID=UPI00324C0EB6
MQENGKSRSFSDWRPSDRGDTIGWAAAFFWAGLILLAQTINFSSNFNWWDGWAIFFTGAGAITLIGVVIRLLVPKYPAPSMWDVIWGSILLAIGLSSWEGWAWIRVMVLFAIGFIILLGAFSRRR